MSISMPGMGTGLDIQGMAKQMSQADLQAQSNQLTKKETDITGEIAALEELDAALTAFHHSVDSLSDPETFGNLKIDMSDDEEDFFEVEVDENAVASSYEIEVDQLATKDKWSIWEVKDDPNDGIKPTKTSITDKDQDVAITMANGDSFTVKLEAGDTLTDLMDKINDSPDNPGIDASIVSGSSGAQLTITSNETGTENAIAKIDLGDGTVLEDLPADSNHDGFFDSTKPHPAHIKPAQNAQFSVDGIEIESQSNEVEDAITGVTLELKQVTEKDEPITVDLKTDTKKMESSIESLVDSYNALKEVIDRLSEAEPAEPGQPAVRPPLAGDTLITSLNSQLRTAFTTPVDASNLETLASIGVITKQNGDLEIDSKMLDKALEEDPQEVVDLFIGEDAVLERLEETVEIYIGTKGLDKDDDDDDDSGFKLKKDGLIDDRLEGLREDQSDVEDEWADINERAEDLYQRYFNELNQMDLAVQQMNASMQNLDAMLVSTI